MYTLPTLGVLEPQQDGSFRYTPYSNVYGSDSFIYRTYDGQVYSETATVTINIDPVEDAPIAFPDNFATLPSQPLIVDAPGVLWNDFDPEGFPLSAEEVTGVSHGLLEFDPSGAFVYTPEAGYFGDDTFSYRVFDGELYSVPVIVTITIEAFSHIYLPLVLK